MALESTPEFRAAATSAMCSLMPRPHVLTGYLRQMLIDHFAQARYIENPEIRSKIWASLPEDTQIEIESITRWKPASTEFRPAVVLARNAWKVLRFGIADRMMGEVTDVSGTEHFASFIQGSHTLFCLSNLATEAEIIGAEVGDEMKKFAPLIIRELDLKRFQLMEVGKLFEIEEARGNYAVPVTVGYVLEDRWKLVPDAPFLKRIVLSRFLP